MRSEKKHAYLIMAFNNFYVLEKLLLLLDDSRNDIYVHIDKKTNNFDITYFEKLITKTSIYFIERKNVYWADYSQVDVTLDLLKTAVQKQAYHYYHLLSGADLPIKSQDYIHDFLADKECEFIGIVPEIFWYSVRRVKYYFPFLNTAYYRKWRLFKALVSVLVLSQRFFRVNRLKSCRLQIYNGWQWFSISTSFAKHLIEKKPVIEKVFHQTLAADELFVQTMAYNSDFKTRLYDVTDLKNGSMRHIDWQRGKPYVFRSADFADLMRSRCLFARKFDESLDKEIVDRIYEQLKNYD